LEPFQVVAAVFVVAVLAYMIRLGVGRWRHEHRLLDSMCEGLGLQRDTIRSAPWALDTIKVAQGNREGIPVSVAFDMIVGEFQEETMTTVRIEWPTSVSTGVTMDRFAAGPEPGRLAKRFPALGQPLVDVGMRIIDRPWFERCLVYGSDAELERVFNPTIRGKLDELPRRLAAVSLHDRQLKIHWFGLEEEPQVVELVFRIGIDCLKALAPGARSGAPRGGAWNPR